MTPNIFDLPGPQISNNESGPEPTMREIIQFYYYRMDHWDDVARTEAYVNKWNELHNTK